LFFLSRKYLISFSYLAISVLGILAFLSIAVEYTPSIQLPSITVSYGWGRTSPEVVERELTRKVEGIVNQIRGVEQVRSITQQGRSAVTVNFRKDAAIDYRVLELREQLSREEELWPEGVSTARISRSIPKDLEETEDFMIYTFSGAYEPNELLKLAENKIRNTMLGKQGLVDVTIAGVDRLAVIIDFDADKANRLALNPALILADLRERLQTKGAGFIQKGPNRYNIQLPPTYSSIEQLKQHPIAINSSSAHLVLADIATVYMSTYPPTQIRRINGLPSLSISFVKEKGSDAFALAEWIEAQMQRIEEQELPDGLTLRKQYDATESLRLQFDRLKEQMLYSILLVFVVVLLFIRQLRAPLIILGSIIFSILMAVAVLFYLGFSLNVLTLAGLTVAVGMLIDNAVVVFEQIHKKGQYLVNRKERIKHCVQEVPKAVVPVLASTLTTVGIFVPLLFALDELRVFLVPIATALSLTLVASAIIAFTWIPYAYVWLIPSRFAKVLPSQKTNKRAYFFGEIRTKWHSILRSFGKKRPKKKMYGYRFFYYRNRLRYVLLAVLIAAVGLPTFLLEETLFVSKDKLKKTPFGTYTVPKDSVPAFVSWYFDYRDVIDPWVGGLPYYFNRHVGFGSPWNFNYPERISVRIYGPQGTPITEFDKAVKNFELVAEPYKEAFSYYEAQISEYGGVRMSFEVKDEALFTAAPYRFLGEAMYLGARTGNLWCSVSGFGNSISTGMGGSFNSQRIVLYGYEYDKLKDFATSLKVRLQKNSRVKNVDINATNSYSDNEYLEYTFDLDEEALAARGIDKRAFLRSAGVDLNPANSLGQVFIEGEELSFLGRNVYDRKVYAPEVLSRKRSSPTQLQNNTVGSLQLPQTQNETAENNRLNSTPQNIAQTLFSINDIGTIKKAKALSAIRRENQEYQRVISFEYSGRSEAASDYRQEIIESTLRPEGIRIVNNRTLFSFGKKETYGNLGLVAILSLICVWMIITALLENWQDALTVLMVLPLCGLGIMAGAIINEISFERGAIAGTLLCVGVAVNNAILLVHQKQMYAALGIFGTKAWTLAYKNKIRPIAITTLTTIGGLLPLAFFKEDIFWQNVAIVVIWGLAGSTILSVFYLGLSKATTAKSHLDTFATRTLDERSIQ